MAFEIEQHWAIFKVLWDLVTLDLDQLERLSERVRKVRIAEIQRTISKLNDVHRWLTSASYKLSSRFAIDYAKMRKEANAEVRKQWVRDSIMAEYGFRCAGCGSTDRLTIDHIVPVARGGSSERGNLQVLCFTCNCKKGYSAPPRVTVT